MTTRARPLLAIKLLHTIVWAFFVACIVLIPLAAWVGRFGLAFALIALVMLEVIVLGMNGWRCPLTGVAARYTEQRQDNFDIFLPVWVARYNKQIFGTLFVLGILVTASRWFGWPV